MKPYRTSRISTTSLDEKRLTELSPSSIRRRINAPAPSPCTQWGEQGQQGTDAHTPTEQNLASVGRGEKSRGDLNQRVTVEERRKDVTLRFRVPLEANLTLEKKVTRRRTCVSLLTDEPFVCLTMVMMAIERFERRM